ncbi:hypothetical protein GUJ93_ZPchr0012g22212 [Zizania palustris]|uniref:Uncharacterized protein n=1 Tax=Zizania palustris TaxID=103762 RepID=A0A8J6BT96_ZIZPA|nr:hypothetical protein GUJ93_ZPchr0012g22212 [Zizania palustris]
MEEQPLARREVILGRNVDTASFAVKEPEVDDDETSEREATMASVLALYRRSLVERTKHHLGMSWHSSSVSSLSNLVPVDKMLPLPTPSLRMPPSLAFNRSGANLSVACFTNQDLLRW